MMPRLSFLFSALFLAAGLTLGACYLDAADMRLETAKRIATPSFMLHREIRAEPFILTTYERIHDRGGPASVYIEGDGVAWVSKSRPSLDPTPRNPVALHLASRDVSPNVIYLARPCQYSRMTTVGACDAKYWTSDRFAPEVVAAMNTALDNMKAKYGLAGFNLVGFSGGGAMAALLTARRDDVLTLRTAAGNLNHVLLNDRHGVSQMPHSLNPADIAAQIAQVPQHHFIGEWDKVVTADIYDSFRLAAGPTSCMRSSTVRRVTHEDGWVNIWPTILKAPIDCRGEPVPQAAH